jgi:UDP-glucose:(heptosyl)LPS alpha-1,3-glucosyltransferase
VRIAFVVHDYNRTHGHSRYVAELAERFAAEHEVHVFANRFEDLPERITGHRVPAVRASALLSIFSFIVPATLMVGHDFDIVHAQGLTMRGANVITAHICNARWLEGRRLLEGGQAPWRERVFGALVIPAERWAFRGPQATVIAISEALRADLMRLYGVRGDTVVVPHGVDLRQFNPGVRATHRHVVRKELGLLPDQVAFLYVGDLRKGFAPAVRALASVAGARLVGVSRTNPREFMATATASGVADRVRVCPPTNQIERYYAAADALVLPTPYDAFGMVITEAMACGLPVITTPLAGAAELITPGVEGLLVESPTDVEALAAAMRALTTTQELRERMGAAAAALMTQHTWDRVAARTLEVYRQHLTRRPTSRPVLGR